MQRCRHLVFVLGDPLDEHSTALADVDPATDIVLMAEVPEESRHVWSAKARTAFFFAAMRHFAVALEKRQLKLDYRRIGTHPFESLAAGLTDAVRKYRPQAIVVVEPGDWRVEQALLAFGRAANVELQIREDTHFLCSRRAFADWASGYKQLRLEFFYRMMRRRHDVMMEGNAPLQGRWNFDAENRGAFSKAGNTSSACRIIAADAATGPEPGSATTPAPSPRFTGTFSTGTRRCWREIRARR